MTSNMKKVRIKPGDVYAIPRNSDSYHLVVFVTSNMWGDAFGILDGFTNTGEIPRDPRPAPAPNPVYSGRGAIIDGRWKRVGNSHDLLSLFSAEPEIYHESDPSNDLIGPYGSAELPSGKLRDVSQDEANRIHLGSTYFQIMAPEQLESYLNTGNPLKGLQSKNQARTKLTNQ